MTGFRNWGLTLLALTIVVQAGKSQNSAPCTRKPCCTPATVCQPGDFCVPCTAGCQAGACCVLCSPATEESCCAIYSLEGLGDDPSFGQWVASTIPEMIEPGSWNKVGPTGRKQCLSYFGPKRILVVYHTPAVQAKVDSFLKGVKNALPKKEEKCAAGKDQGVVRASYNTPQTMNAPEPAGTQSSGYPVPAAARPPKHLFHFIIRYEGAGIIDDSVVNFLKTYNETAKVSKEECEATPPSIGGAIGAITGAFPPRTPCEEKKEEKVKEGDEPKSKLPELPASDKSPDSRD